MALRRGFKSEAAALAREVRGELGLDSFDRLDPYELAGHLGIPILPLSDLPATSPGVRHFLSSDREAFSALTVFAGNRRIIVHNDSHSGARQNSNLTHELAHPLLLHEPRTALDNVTGCRDWNDTYEQEADWLSGELLVTSHMALAVARGRLTRQEARHHFGVSDDMLRWRLNTTGAQKRVERERARWGANKSRLRRSSVK